ncbi:MAG: phosphoribosylformylglycinamidine cyclo-ligase [bacterium]|jgi:phosphoribosylformylglycinamidine cyclo-ligase|nr:phosphoribosylformylglycinamidine cyclo-ligase [bacterium]
MIKNPKLTYKDAGVDIEAGNEAVRRIKPAVESTRRPEVLTGIGGFGGLFAVPERYRQPVLVSGTDGVGTKLQVAFMTGIHNTIGIDAVAMCVNDILVQGAEPLFFLDYLAVGKLDPDRVADIVGGVAEGCRQAGCALIGGETAEMPGFYQDDEYDIAGFAVGAVERDQIIDGSTISSGDILIGLPSTGLHSNGYSLARKVLFDFSGYSADDYVDTLGQTVGEALMAPTRIYVLPVLELMRQVKIKAMAHITGGGLLENIPRSFSSGLQAILKKGSWSVPPLFHLLQQRGGIEEIEMYRTFNMGIGFVIIVGKESAGSAIKRLQELGEPACVIGELSTGGEGVVLGA